MHVTVEKDGWTETRGVCGACMRALPGRCPLHPAAEERGPSVAVLNPSDGKTYRLPLTVAIARKGR